MKNILFISLLFFLVSCSQTMPYNLNPTLEIETNNDIKWNDKEYKIDSLKSILTKYTSEIQPKDFDSIRINLIVGKEIKMGTMQTIKTELFKSKLRRINYFVED